MTPVAVFIADDETPARNRLRTLLEDIIDTVPTNVVGEARNGLEVLEQLPGSGARVLLLDIAMPGMDGLEVARHLARLPQAPAVIFITAHDRHAVEAFEVHALDFLMKPVRATRLAEALQRAAVAAPTPTATLAGAAAQAGAAPRGHFSLTERNRILLVPVADVLYLRAEQKYVTLRTHEREHLVDESLVALEREFAERFVRIHRNCLVARAAVRGFERSTGEGNEEAHWEVLLEGVPERLPVSRRQWAAVRAEVKSKPARD
ncbi:MAG TPA: LytTR family DNA-binding domain-containing protein [Burkholderiales bacterium]